MLAGGWIPDADEAKLIGLVAEVSDASILLDVADKRVQNLISEHRRRAFLSTVVESEVGQEYSIINEQESIALADSCLSLHFLINQSQLPSSFVDYPPLCLSMVTTLPLGSMQLI